MAKDKRLEEEILSVIREMLGKEVSLEDKIEDIPEWDSLKHLQIILEIEDKLRIKIPIEHIGKIERVSDLIQMALKLISNE